MMATDYVESVLPHRYPMLLVDRVLELRYAPLARIRAVKAVTCNELWYRDRGGEGHDYPNSMVVESWCQAAALLALRGVPLADGAVIMLGRISGVRFHAPVSPGDVLQHEARLVHDAGKTLVFEGASKAGAKKVIDVGSVVLAIRPGVATAGGGATDD